MKFIVDETPIYKSDCPLCLQFYGKTGYVCKFDEEDCDLDDDEDREGECRWLKEMKSKEVI